MLPHLKVTVWMGRFNLETLGTQEIDTYYESSLDPDLWTSNARPDRYFLSKNATGMPGFGFRDRVEGGVCVFSNGGGRPDSITGLAETSAQAVSRVLDVSETKAFAVLHLILGAVGQLRGWQLPIAAVENASILQVRCAKEYVDAIYARTGLSFPAVNERECLISEWPNEVYSNSAMT